MGFMQDMMVTSPGIMLPTPVDYTSSATVALVFSIWAGGFALLVLPFAFRKLVRDRDPVMLLMWAGGLVCSLLEPMLDHLGHLWWSRNLPGPSFSGYGLDIPYLIPPCYVFFIAMTGYWAARKLQEGQTVGGVFRIWFLIAMTDVIMEIPGTFTGAYTYYGDAPFTIFGFPLVWGWLNGTSMLMVGFLLWRVLPHLRGWNRTFIVLVPISAMGAAYGMVAWPYFLALNWPMPTWCAWLWSGLSFVLSLIAVRFVAAVATDAEAIRHSGRSAVLAT